MPRPPKFRRVAFLPEVSYFKPAGIPLRVLEEILVSIEEAEAIRLRDLEGLEQEECAKRMGVSRPTFQRVLESGRQKIADAVLHGKAIRIAGGNFEVSGAKHHRSQRVSVVREHNKEVTMQDLIQEFMAQKKFAVVGATDDTTKYGNEIFLNLRSRGYEVYPVNPRLKEFEGIRCYPSLSDIPVKVDVVDFVVPSQVTEEILKECKRLGLDRIWLQPGSESETAINYCHENNLKVVHDVCVMMN